MSVVGIPREKLKGKYQVDSTVFVPKTQTHGHQTVIYNQLKPFTKEVTRIPNIMNDAIQRPMALKTRGCEDEAFSKLVVRRQPVNKMNAYYPHTGVFRHEKKGLATDPNKPNNLPLMPLANTFYAGLNNSIAPVR